MKLNKITVEKSPYRWLFAILVCIAIGWFIIGIKQSINEARQRADQAYTDSLTKANLAVDTSKYLEGGRIPPIDTFKVLLNLHMKLTNIVDNINHQDLLFYKYSALYYKTEIDKYRIMGDDTQYKKEKLISSAHVLTDSIKQLSNHSEIKK